MTDAPDETWPSQRIDIDAGHRVLLGRLPGALQLDAAGFETLWELHPDGFHEVRIFGRTMPVPRWSETYGRDYHFSGTVQRARPVPALLKPYLAWCRAHVDPRHNGLLVNWYDGALGHRIGPHRDDEQELIAGAPIVTISFGETRDWRLKPWQPGLARRGTGGSEETSAKPAGATLAVGDGSVLVLPWSTNLAYTHEVPHRRRHTGRRISITVRAFR